MKKPVSHKVKTAVSRKRADDALPGIENLYQTLAESSPDIIYIVDADGVIQYINLRAAQAYGQTPADLIGKRTDIAFPQEIARHYMEELDLVVTTKEQRVIELLEQFPKGARWMSTRLVPITGSGGEVIQILGISTDVTERKRAEESLLASEEKYRSMVEASPGMIWEIDKQGIFSYISPQTSTQLGYTPEELMGKPFLSLIPPESAPAIKNTFLAHIQDKNFFKILEVPAHRRDGSPCIIEIRSLPIIGNDGQITGFRGIAQDITDTKKAEEARRESEKRFRIITETIDEVFWMGDVEIGKIFYISPSFERIWGRSRESLYENPRSFLDAIHGEDRERVLATLEVEKTGQPFDHEYRIILPDGNIRHIWDRGFPLPDENGQITRYTGVAMDITGRKRAEEALRQINKKLNLLCSITRHDILNQLLGLRGYIRLSREVIDNPEKILEFIKKEEKVTNTIEQQITFTKDYHNLGVAAPTWQNVNECIRSAMASLPMRAVHVELDPADPEVYADPLFEKVFFNLIDNALCYGSDQMKTIRVLSQESDQGLTIVYENDGVGIKEEDKKRIFTRGFGKNTGFGLFLSREILSITGITITENGVPGKGTRFEITVPNGTWRTAGNVT